MMKFAAILISALIIFSASISSDAKNNAESEPAFISENQYFPLVKIPEFENVYYDIDSGVEYFYSGEGSPTPRYKADMSTTYNFYSDPHG